MITGKSRSRLLLLSGLASVTVLCTAGYSMLNTGVYLPGTPEDMIPGAVSQDAVSLLAAMGVLLCIVLMRRGDRRVWLVWSGLLGYLLYAYALYSFDRVYNQFFLCYVAILGLTLYSLIMFFAGADLGSIRLRPGRRPPPRRSTGIVLLALAAMFLFLWLSILIPAMNTRVPPEGNSIFVMDLAFFLPLLTVVGIQLLRRTQLGDALAIPVLVKMGTLGISVMLGALLAPLFGREIDPGSVAVYAFLGILPLACAVPFLRALGTDGGVIQGNASATVGRTS